MTKRRNTSTNSIARKFRDYAAHITHEPRSKNLFYTYDSNKLTSSADHYCPFLYAQTFQHYYYYGGTIKNIDLTLPTRLQHIRSLVILAFENPGLDFSSLRNLLTGAVDFIEKKNIEAQAKGKKLVVIFGEHHGFASSLLIELLLLSYIKTTTGASNLFLEASQDVVEWIQTKPDRIAAFFGMHYLGFKPIATDPTIGLVNDGEKLEPANRDEVIARNIEKEANEAVQAGIFGATHVPKLVSHLANSNILVAAIRVGKCIDGAEVQDKPHNCHHSLIRGESAITNLCSDYALPKVEWYDACIPVESFSLNQILELYTTLAPYMDKYKVAFIPGGYIQSEFLTNPRQCQIYEKAQQFFCAEGVIKCDENFDWIAGDVLLSQ